MINKIYILFLGILLRPFLTKYPVKSNIWVFGAQNGQAYVDNSKFLFEYIIKNQKGLEAVWITRSKTVLNELKEKDLPVEHNLSAKGIWYIMRASAVVFSTSRSDLLFVFQKKNRSIVNLWHGMPIKKIVYDYGPHRPENRNWRAKILDKFVTGFQHNQTDIVCSTSSFYSNILKSSFRNQRVFVTGQPRTDVFYLWERNKIKEKMGFESDERVITYMPTHRAYGTGKMNPKVFKSNSKALELLKKNQAKLVWKFHKNMLTNYDNSEIIPGVIVDLTIKNVDPQELLFITDILITDYSSCYIDFLLFNRPIIFFQYDDYEGSDNELYFSIGENNPGPVVKTENELENELENLLDGKDEYDKRRNYYLEKYHRYKDGNSSKRVFELVSRS